MAVNKAHLVAESALDASEHVEDVGADCSDAGKLLAASKPHVELDDLVGLLGLWIGLTVGDVQVHVDVLEVSCQTSLLARHLDGARLDLDLHYTHRNGVSLVSSITATVNPFSILLTAIGNVDTTGREQGLHGLELTFE